MEWIGDAFFALAVKKLLIHHYPNASMACLSVQFSKITANHYMCKFAKANNISDANWLEIEIGRLIGYDESEAYALVEKYFKWYSNEYRLNEILVCQPVGKLIEFNHIKHKHLKNFAITLKSLDLFS